jgi:hypothetical protein
VQAGVNMVGGCCGTEVANLGDQFYGNWNTTLI